jgi:hypothetical protein
MFPTGAALGATGVVPVGAFYWRAAESVALAAAAPRSFTDTSFTDTERLKAVGLRSVRETASDDHHGSTSSWHPQDQTLRHHSNERSISDGYHR